MFRLRKSISDSSADNSKGETNISEVVDRRLMGKFVDPNVIDLTTRLLFKAEMFLLFNALKFIATPTRFARLLFILYY